VTTNAEATEALLHWERAVRVATRRLSQDLARIPKSVADEPPALLLEISKWLLKQVEEASRSTERKVSTLRFTKIQEAHLQSVRSRTRSEWFGHATSGVAEAEGWITYFARRIRLPDRNTTPVQEAERCIERLAHLIHPKFASLRRRRQQVAELLERYEPHAQRRRTPRGVPSKLSSAGILAEINKLAGSPLGQSGSLKPNAIANRVTRK
jgi:hypothetical protein